LAFDSSEVLAIFVTYMPAGSNAAG
jgi:hypothetical protein